MAPWDRRAAFLASSSAASTSATRKSTTVASSRRPRWRGKVRERIVGRRRPGREEVRTKKVPSGGSSSSFRRALAASGLDAWGTSSSASATMKTCRDDMAGFFRAFLRRVRAMAR